VGKKLNDKLIQAVYDEKQKAAIDCIEKGAGINARNHKQQTVLSLAANRGLNNVVRLLIEKGAEIDSRDQWGQTPLMRAAYNNHPKVLHLLLDHGADIHARNSNGKTPLLYSADGGSKDAFHLLISKGADIGDMDDAHSTVLMYFTMHDDPEMVRYILDNCNNKDQLDWNGKSALDYAVEEGLDTMVRLLKEAGVGRGGSGEIDRRREEKHARMIKKVRCPSCGAPKMNEYRHAYIYCDFCGSFMDFDYHLARQIEPVEEIDPQTEALREQNRLYSMYSIIDWMTYPEYLFAAEALQKEGIVPEQNTFGGKVYTAGMCEILEENGMGYPFLCKTALEQKDADWYARLGVKMEKERIDSYPGVFSPKIADENYRREYLHFIYESDKAVAEQEEVRGLMSELKLREIELLYDEHYVDSSSFWVQFTLTKNFWQTWAEELDCRNIFAIHPDRIRKDQFINLQQTLFLQSWFPKLSPADTRKALDITGTLETFTPFFPERIEERHCGRCGGELSVLKDARRIVCESCGALIDVNEVELPCPSCSYLLSMPVETDRISCPACGTIVTKG
jgi:ankyrin repeat protein/DNA-directed RNA polymerase subunit RPC12/RpoP